MKTTTRKLYWVSDGGDEDWFVFSTSKRSATLYFNDCIGTDGMVLQLADDSEMCNNVSEGAIKEDRHSDGRSAFAEIPHLEQLGFKIISDGIADGQRVVWRGGETYTEGSMEAKIQKGIKNISSNVLNLKQGDN